MESTNPSRVGSGSDKSTSVKVPKHVQEDVVEYARSLFSWGAFQIQAENQTYSWPENLCGPRKPYEEEEAEIKGLLEVLDRAGAAGDRDPNALFLFRSAAIERLHSERVTSGLYKELEDISSQMRIIEEREGPDEFMSWSEGEAAEEWYQLDNQYDEILDVKFEETLREVGLEDMADLYHVDRRAYDARREQGEVLVNCKTPDLYKLSSVQKHFESEADACVQAGAYLAASVMLGGAIEAALLFACLNDPGATRVARAKLGRKKTERQDPKRWTLKHLVNVAFSAGWLPNFETDDFVLVSEPVADAIREFRNAVHPSRHLRPGGGRYCKYAFRKARAAYVILDWQLAKRGRPSSIKLDHLDLPPRK